MAEVGLFDGVLARGAVREQVDDRAWLQAMLDFEAGLARAQGRLGLIPAEHAGAIADACRVERFSVSELGAEAAASGNPVVPLVRALRGAVGGAAADDVHRAATSQDVLDTAAMLVARRALGPLLADLDATSGAAAELAARHRETPMAGRTLLQQALPVTFGLKAAGWMTALDEAIVRLLEVRDTRLAVELGGPVGALPDGVELVGELARELGLVEPVLPWHTARGRVAELAGTLGVVCGAAGKVARDVVLLAQTEVGEVREAGEEGRGGSSAMAHKRNPVAALATLGCAQQAPGLVATLLGSMVQEHERAAGAWHAEWRPFGELLRVSGSAAAWLRDCLERLELDAGRMRANLELLREPLGAAELERVADPAPAATMVDRALRAHAARRTL